jgi:RNA polymerase sigma-70 factor (ECF subfamily)
VLAREGSTTVALDQIMELIEETFGYKYPSVYLWDGSMLRLYVERFNQQDWDGLRALIAADARLRVADAFAGRLDTSPYFGKYATVRVPWRMAAGEVDGEPAVIILHRLDDRWTPRSATMLELTDGRVSRIADFWHITWLLDAADSVVLW